MCPVCRQKLPWVEGTVYWGRFEMFHHIIQVRTSNSQAGQNRWEFTLQRREGLGCQGYTFEIPSVAYLNHGIQELEVAKGTRSVVLKQMEAATGFAYERQTHFLVVALCLQQQKGILSIC